VVKNKPQSRTLSILHESLTTEGYPAGWRGNDRLMYGPRQAGVTDLLPEHLMACGTVSSGKWNCRADALSNYPADKIPVVILLSLLPPFWPCEVVSPLNCLACPSLYSIDPASDTSASYIAAPVLFALPSQAELIASWLH